MEGLDAPPIPSAAGQKIFETVSKAAWVEWIKLQTMLINEGQLNSLDPNTRAMLKDEREKFLSNAEDVAQAAGYVPIKDDD
jgi:Fe-S cluster biosynthesis and repair protein YggX